ncbi:unnamed protein product [Effrenium voratum]|nr:unnamed protein product [Effrenium voratum]
MLATLQHDLVISETGRSSVFRTTRVCMCLKPAEHIPQLKQMLNAFDEVCSWSDCVGNSLQVRSWNRPFHHVVSVTSCRLRQETIGLQKLLRQMLQDVQRPLRHADIRLTKKTSGWTMHPSIQSPEKSRTQRYGE